MKLGRLKLSLPKLKFRFFSSRKHEPPIPTFDSLGPSLALSQRLASWSGTSDRTHPCSMSFHKEWRHPDCKVMRWYEMQTQSSTIFETIQHWQCSEGPFYHEYLLIKLTDGSLCRVERMGDGSRADALRWIGCSAHDIIQWFSAEDHVQSSLDQKPPRLIIEVRLPRVFDLLDVLAICYSIQKHPRASSYTLQAYNCYFFCSTVLAVLTRRLEEWESSITESLWKDMVESTLKDLSHEGISSKDAREFLAFGIFSLTNPDSQNPAEFILESLRSELNNTALNSLNDELSKTLWQSDLPLATKTGLSRALKDATRACLDGSDPNSVMLRSIVLRLDAESRVDENEHPSPEWIREAACGIILDAFNRGVDFFMERKQTKTQRNQPETKDSNQKKKASHPSPSSFRSQMTQIRILRNTYRRLESVDTELMSRVQNEIRGRFRVTLSHWRAFSTQSSDFAEAILVLLQAQNWASNFESDEDLADALAFSLEHALNHTLPIVQKLIDASPRDEQAILSFFKLYVLEDFWEISVWTCVLEKIGGMAVFSTSNTIKVYAEDSEKDWTVANFQSHLSSRIQDHASRVELFQLATAKSVREDIRTAISDVWRSLPVDFGRRAVTLPPADTARQQLTPTPNHQLFIEGLKYLHNCLGDIPRKASV